MRGGRAEVIQSTSSELIGNPRVGWERPVLHLDPVITAAGLVGALAVLGDLAFQTHAAGRLKQIRPNLSALEERDEDALGPAAQKLREVRFPQVSGRSRRSSPPRPKQSKA